MKPDYRVPSMAEVQQLRASNGYTMVSTFSGCGGSCLGFEMAGFDVLWANEFVDEARATYAANHPGVILDGRDVRQISAEELLATIGLRRGELDVLEGSPPCASFSTAGSREKGWGKVKAYSDTQQRADDLFHEFARLLEGLQPRTFAAENVSGLVKGTAKGYFKEILVALRSCGYAVSARLLDASLLGVPQARQRLIFVGVRNDLVDAHGVLPQHPKPRPYRYTVAELLPHIRRIKIGGKPHDYRLASRTAPTFTASDATTSPTAYLSSGGLVDTTDGLTVDPETGWDLTLARYGAHVENRRRLTLQELRLLSSFPADFALTGTFAQRWERIGRSVPPLMARAIAETIRDDVLRVIDRD